MIQETDKYEQPMRLLDAQEMAQVEGGHQDAHMDNGKVVLRNWDGSTRSTNLRVLPPGSGRN